MIRGISLSVTLLIAGCATTQGTATSLASQLYDSADSYRLALTGAVNYAESPIANAQAVSAIKRANDIAQPALRYSLAYAGCRAQSAGVVNIEGVIVECSTFNFAVSAVAKNIGILKDAKNAVASHTDKN